MSRVVFVTGSASGIGKQVAETFLKQGDKVVFSDFNAEKLNETVKGYQAQGFECHGIVVDVTKESDINNAVDEIVAKYGTVHVLVNNAGLQYVAMIEDFPTEKFEYMLKVMTVAPFIAIKNVFPLMKAQGFGRIINMASINALIGFAGKSAYNTAKHALLGLTRVAALEAAGKGVTVNAICPGYTDTPLVRGQFVQLSETRNIPLENVLEQVLYPLVPLKRLLDVQEIADYIAFLASEKAGGITGQACVIDGGYTTQ